MPAAKMAPVMPTWTRWLLLLTFIAVVLLLAPIAHFACSAWEFGRPSPKEIAAREHHDRGRRLEAEGRLDDAIAEYRLAKQDGLYPMMTRRIAGLLEDAGRFEEALAEIDREGPEISWGEYCDLRATCLERWRGPQAAVE